MIVPWERYDGNFFWRGGAAMAQDFTLCVGTVGGGLSCSPDGGKTWKALSLGVTLPCPIGIPRTTNMIVDPRDHRVVWAGIEVDGVYQSRDGGDNWVHLPALGPDPFQGDIHGLALRTGEATAIYATTPFGIATSTDEGENWEYHNFPKFHEADA